MPSVEKTLYYTLTLKWKFHLSLFQRYWWVKSVYNFLGHSVYIYIYIYICPHIIYIYIYMVFKVLTKMEIDLCTYCVYFETVGPSSNLYQNIFTWISIFFFRRYVPHRCLVLRLRMSGAKPLLLLWLHGVDSGNFSFRLYAPIANLQAWSRIVSEQETLACNKAWLSAWNWMIDTLLVS